LNSCGRDQLIKSLIVWLNGDKPHWEAHEKRGLLIARLDGDVRDACRERQHAITASLGIDSGCSAVLALPQSACLSGEQSMTSMLKVAAVLGATMIAVPAAAQTKVAIGISGWTGFAPLTLAKEAGIFARNGLDVTIKKIPQASRHLAIASGDVQCAATTVETWIVWNANGVATTQLFQLDKSYGADGLVVRKATGSIKDLKGKTVAASAPGTSPYFLLAWFLKKNGLSVKDVTVVNMEPGPAAQAFIAGQNDAAATYEPYLSAVREKPDAGKIIATTLDYPMVMDTFGCTPKFIAENDAAVKALTKSYFDALDMIKNEQAKAYEIMGADVKQSGEAFGKSAAYLRWQDKEANKKFFTGDFPVFTKEAADLLLEIGVIKAIPDLSKLADPKYVQ
jgi:NitT/TauT family transport system substrate-binding protein